MAERLRVLIVDDQRLLCEGFRKLIELESDLEVVGMAGTAKKRWPWLNASLPSVRPPTWC